MQYGNTVQHWRVGIEYGITWQSDTQADVTCKTYFCSIAWGYDTAAIGTATVNGQSASTPSASGSRKTAYSPSGGTVNQLFITKTVRVNKKASGFNVPVSGVMQLVGGYHNGTSSTSGNVWVPAINYKAPAAPTGLAVERVSDTSHKLTWQNVVVDNLHPVSGNIVKRLMDDGATATTLYNSRATTNYDDGSTEAGHKYTYTVYSTGAGGTSGASSAVTVYTSPLAPSINATKDTLSSVMLTITKAPAYVNSYECQVTTDAGKTWVDKTLTPSGKGLSDTTPPAGTIKYRVRAVVSGIAGAWGESNTIVTICPPFAPSLGALHSAYATGSSVAITWTPNHPDGTAQSAAQVDVVKDGASLIHDIAGATASYTIADAANGAYQVRVRTKGQHADWGEWSAYTSFTVATAPTLIVNTPAKNGVIKMLPLNITWTASDATGITEQSVTVAKTDGTVLYSGAPGKDSRSLSLGPDVGFTNNTSYVLTITVSAGSTLSVTANVPFSSSWQTPDAPTVDIEYTDGMAATIQVTAADTTPKAVRFDIVRIAPDGMRLTIGTDLTSGQQAIDRLPPLNVEYKYEVTAYAETDALTKLDVPATAKMDGVAFNFGPDAATAWVGKLNPSYSRDIEHSVTTYHMLNGSDMPTAWPTGETDVSENYSFSIDAEDFARIDSLARRYYECWVRDAYGKRSFGVINFSTSRESAGWWKLTAKLTVCAWEEPVNG